MALAFMVDQVIRLESTPLLLLRLVAEQTCQTPKHFDYDLLARNFGVSYHTIRDSMAKLHSAGLVTYYPQQRVQINDNVVIDVED